MERKITVLALMLTLVSLCAHPVLSVSFEEASAGQASGASQVTSASISEVDNHLMIAAVTSSPNNTVTSVSGLGLSWSQRITQCSGNNTISTEVWTATGQASESGGITASLSATADTAHIEVLRYSGTDPLQPIGANSSWNSNGESGACSGGATESEVFANATLTTENSTLLGILTWNSTSSYSLNPSYSLRKNQTSSQLSTVEADDQKGITGEYQVNATLSSPADWASLGLELRESQSSLSWNQTSLDLGETHNNSGLTEGSLELTANSVNNNTQLSCSGDCSVISNNFTTQNLDSQTVNVGFNCTSQTPGSYSADFNATSEFFPTGSVVTVSCSIIDARADLVLNDSRVGKSGSEVEGTNITLTANVSNTGDESASNVNVSFYKNGNNYLGADVITVTTGSFNTASINHTVDIGDYYVTAVADADSSITEYNESNNEGNVSINTGSYQLFLGNITGKFLLGDNVSNIIYEWEKTDITGSNVFATDSDSSVSWESLLALTRNQSGIETREDFDQADLALGIETHSDSLNETYNSNFVTESFTVFDNNINNVPVVETNSSDFRTGILWDSSDDSSGGYDEAEKEDLVFVSKTNASVTNDLGTHDYEIQFPAVLRSYSPPDNKDSITVYVELK